MNMRWSLLFSVTGIGVLTLGTILFLIVPTTRVIRSLHQAIEHEQLDAEERYFHRQKNRNTITHIAEIRAELPALQSLALPEGQELSFIEHIESLANTHALEETVRLLPPTTGTKTYQRKLQIILTLTGDPRALGAFLNDLEQQDPLFLITTMNIEQTEKPGVVAASIQGWVSWPEQTEANTL